MVRCTARDSLNRSGRATPSSRPRSRSRRRSASTATALAQQQHADGHTEHRHQVVEDAGGRRADLLDRHVVPDEGQRRAAARRGTAARRSCSSRIAPGMQASKCGAATQRQQQRSPERGVVRGRQRRKPAEHLAADDGVQRPRDHRREHEQLARADAAAREAGDVAARNHDRTRRTTPAALPPSAAR